MNLKKTPTGRGPSNYFLILFTVYLTIILTPIVLVHKIITVFGITTSACLFIYPLSYTCCDLIAEVYGYKLARKAVWLSVFSNIIFSGLISLVVRYPAPANWPHQGAYLLVLGGLFSIAIGALVGTLLGSFINIYFITKWKALTHGRLFWLRSIGSSMIGEIVFTFTSAVIVWSGRLPWRQILVLGLTLFLSKVIYNIIMAGPANLIANFLKKREQVSLDKVVDYNPFSLK